MKRDEVRQVDSIAINEYGISGLVLMENAGRGAAERIAAWCDPADAVRILCGPGNNAGDGYVIARHLELLGFAVDLVALVPPEKLSGDASANAMIAQRSGIPIATAESVSELEQSINGNHVLVDCLLGTGAKGAPRGLYHDAVRLANATDRKRVAIDLPTGLDCDTGQPSEMTFRADLTITFVAAKDGFQNPDAAPFLGHVETVGIGVPRVLLRRFGVV